MDFKSLYDEADEKLKSRFRSRKAYWIKKGDNSEQVAISKAISVFGAPHSAPKREASLTSPLTNNSMADARTGYANSQGNFPNFAKVGSGPLGARRAEVSMKSIKANQFSIFSLKITKYDLIKLSLYILIVPITANTIQAALSKAGLSDWFLVAVSWLLAVVTDYVALDHFSKARKPLRNFDDFANCAIAAIILAANLFGAFLLFKKEIKLERSDITSDEIAKLEEKLESLKVLSSNAYSTYVTKKRPKAADPVACEIGTGTNCGPVYITNSPQAAAANAAKSQYISLELQIKKVESQLKTQLRAMPTDQNRSDFWWHLGYYAFVWFLLLSVIRLEKISLRRSNTVAA